MGWTFLTHYVLRVRKYIMSPAPLTQAVRVASIGRAAASALNDELTIIMNASDEVRHQLIANPSAYLLMAQVQASAMRCEEIALRLSAFCCKRAHPVPISMEKLIAMEEERVGG